MKYADLPPELQLKGNLRAAKMLAGVATASAGVGLTAGLLKSVFRRIRRAGKLPPTLIGSSPAVRIPVLIREPEELQHDDEKEKTANEGIIDGMANMFVKATGGNSPSSSLGRTLWNPNVRSVLGKPIFYASLPLAAVMPFLAARYLVNTADEKLLDADRKRRIRAARRRYRKAIFESAKYNIPEGQKAAAHAWQLSEATDQLAASDGHTKEAGAADLFAGIAGGVGGLALLLGLTGYLDAIKKGYKARHDYLLTHSLDQELKRRRRKVLGREPRHYRAIPVSVSDVSMKDEPIEIRY